MLCIHDEGVRNNFLKVGNSASMQRTLKQIFILLCFVFLAGGCSYSRSIYETVAGTSSAALYDLGVGGSPVLKKRVLVLPFLDQAGLGGEKVEEFTEIFLSQFNKEGHYLIRMGTSPPGSGASAGSPEFGIIADPDAARKAADMGMNIVITAVLSPENPRTRKKGIWPFRRVVADVEIPMIVNAFDVVNGTLYFTHLESVKIETPVEEFDPFFDDDPGTLKYTIDPGRKEQAYDRILERQAQALNRKLREQPWMGRILSVDGSGAAINAGEDVGLKPGAVFEVLGRAETLQSASGTPVSLLGPRIGEIKVTDVKEDHAFAVPLSDVPIQAGKIIRIKR
jgi:hypothetical protein